ncbi:MAG: hypothetical protein HOL31_06000 [Candidatus Scalindua sp.]|nr:hypothetical protein [Candidatus Scalindua sp.]
MILDGEYVHALLGAAYAAGYVTVSDAVSDEEASSAESYLSSVAKSRLRRRALEMLVFYDKVYLADYHEALDIKKLKSDGLIYVNETFSGAALKHIESMAYDGKQLKEITEERLALKQTLLPFIRPFLKELLLTHGLRGRRGQSKDNSDIGKHIAIATCNAAVGELATGEFIPAFRKSLLSLPGIFSEETADAVIERMYNNREFYEEVNFWRMSCHFELEKARIMLQTSSALNLPFVSNRLWFHKRKSRLGDSQSGKNMSTAFRLCQLSMSEEIGYAPVVESLQDVLRLREDERLKRFRDVLLEWSIEVRSGREVAEKRIRGDIKKANQELKKLAKWRKTSRWLCYFSLPLAVLPYISTITNLSSVACQMFIDRKEGMYGWMGITR